MGLNKDNIKAWYMRGREASAYSKAILTIKTIPDTFLTEYTEPQQADQRLYRWILVKKLDRIRRGAGVISMAAPQIGSHKSFFIMQTEDHFKQKLLVFFNPVIVMHSDMHYVYEKCLSVPGLEVKVPRAQDIIIKAEDIKGKQFMISLHDKYAQMAQHEMDHLDGVLITKYIGSDSASTIWDIF